MSTPALALSVAPASMLALGRSTTRALLVLGLLLGLVLLGPVGEANAATRKSHHSSRVVKIQNATNVAVNQIGDPYRWGAAGPGSFDCSGLIYYSFRKAGISVPRTSRAQASHTRRINKANLKRGDLMFFHSRGRVYHAGIFLGRRNGKAVMVNSPSTGKRVQRTTPWTSSWFAGTLRGRG